MTFREPCKLGVLKVFCLLGVVLMKRIINTLVCFTGIFSIFSVTEAQEVQGCFLLDDRGKPVNMSNLCPESQQSENYVKQTISEPGSFSLPIKRRESGIPVVEVVFNGTHSYEMLLDTGASLTLVTPIMAKAIGIKPQGIFVMATPSDTRVPIPKGRINFVEAGGAVNKDLDVAISPALDLGLLGQNFFGKYDITIKRDVVELHSR
jgi:predicted aspartyl protease